jgi:hypothetical protein
VSHTFSAQPILPSAVGPPRPDYASIPFKLALALAIVLLAAVFFRTSNVPTRHLDTWGHWAYGRWIWEQKRLPEREPFTAYSDQGAHLLDTWWLSQVLCYGVYAAGGVEGIALFYALVEVAKTALYLAAIRRACGSLLLAVVGVALLYVGRWTYFGVFRPQAIGEVCWAALLWLSARPPWPKWGTVAAPLLVALWANLHGGFLLAFVLLGACLLNRAWEAMGGRFRPAVALEDAQVRLLALTLVLSLAATSLTPYGPRYLVDVIKFGRTPSLQLVPEWHPPVLMATYGSRALAASLLLVLVTLRWSPRRFTVTDAALLLSLGLGGWFATRLIPFWMTVWPLVLAPHWRAILRQAGWDRFVADRCTSDIPVGPSAGGPTGMSDVPAAASWFQAWWPLVPAGAGAVALLFFSATGSWLLGAPKPLHDRLREETPVAVARDLCEPPPLGVGRPPLRVFCSAEWGDYLVWRLPPPDQVFWYSHWHCYTPQRIVDGNCLLALHGPPHDWKAVLNRYRFNVLALRNDGDTRGLFGYLLEQWGRPESEWDVTVYPDNFAAGLRERTDDLQPAAIWGLVARRRVDPFALTMTGLQGTQSCLGGGMAPGAIDWAVLTHLPWIWPDR